MTWRALIATAALAALGVPVHAQPAVDNRAAIREAEIKRDLFQMAGDEFRGREAGTLDEMRASIWVADMARAAGLKPAGDIGSYFQWWGLRRVRVGSTSSVTIGGASLAMWTDAIVPSIVDARVEGTVTWVGDAVGSSLDALDLQGKIVAAHVLIPANAPGRDVSLRAMRYARLAVAQRAAQLTRKGASAIILVADSTTESAWDFSATISGRGTYGLDTGSTDQRPKFGTPVVVVRRAMAETLNQRGVTAVIDVRSESFVYPSVNIVGVVPGTDPALKNDYGWSAIFYATRNGDADMIHALVAGGANVNDTADVDPSHAGLTPLMWAAFMNLLPQLDALLEHKPRLDIRDRAGNTALDYAMRFRHHEAVARLKAAAGRQ